jgi:FixJ family two-component response regulator
MMELSYHVRKKLRDKQVELAEGRGLTLRCMGCGSTWTVDTIDRRRLPKGYWRCPEGCNEAVGEDGGEGGLRLLLLDDDEELCVNMATILREAGYRVKTFHRGLDLLGEARLGGFDVAVIDLRLPDLDGLEVLRRLREVDPVAGTMVLSGAATLEDAVEALNAGADTFLLKPVEARDLLHKLGAITGFNSLEKELRAAKARYNELFAILQDA